MNALAQYEVHYPVMLPDVLEALKPKDGEIYVDGTFGAGGYTNAILEAAECKVYAIDRDPSAVDRAGQVLAKFPDRFVFLRGCFGDVKNILKEAGVERVDGFVLDVGVSSMQLDEVHRGFSFRFDGPLDMRMDTQGGGQTAADIVNTYDEKDLADIIYRFGEERYSRRVARKVVERREEEEFKTTFDLADVVREAVPRSPKDKNDPATRTFQALRIAVNDELGELARALEAAINILKPGGRLVVVSFHSLEDGLVKKFLREHANDMPSGSRHQPLVLGDKKSAAVFRQISRKAEKPSEKEIAENPRSRSARLRAAIRVGEGV